MESLSQILSREKVRRISLAILITWLFSYNRVFGIATGVIWFGYSILAFTGRPIIPLIEERYIDRLTFREKQFFNKCYALFLMILSIIALLVPIVSSKLEGMLGLYVVIPLFLLLVFFRKYIGHDENKKWWTYLIFLLLALSVFVLDLTEQVPTEMNLIDVIIIISIWFHALFGKRSDKGL